MVMTHSSLLTGLRGLMSLRFRGAVVPLLGAPRDVRTRQAHLDPAPRAVPFRVRRGVREGVLARELVPDPPVDLCQLARGAGQVGAAARLRRQRFKAQSRLLD